MNNREEYKKTLKNLIYDMIKSDGSYDFKIEEHIHFYTVVFKVNETDNRQVLCDDSRDTRKLLQSCSSELICRDLTYNLSVEINNSFTSVMFFIKKKFKE